MGGGFSGKELLMPKIVRPPEGYESWLEYAVKEMDVTAAYLDCLASGNDEVEKKDVLYSALEDLKKAEYFLND